MPLEITGLSKRYANKWALRDVEFTASEGRVLGLLGGTAAGRSTVLNILAGTVKDNGGSAMLDGNELLSVRPKERSVTLIPEREKPGLLDLLGGVPRRSAGESLLDSLDEILTAAGRIILLDDPFSNLDSATRTRCFDAVRRAAVSRERIVIFASADFAQIAAAADDVAVLADERIVQTGSPQNVYDEPTTIAAARLTGDCNLFEARRLTSTDADLPEFHTIDGGHRIFAQRTEKSRLGSIHQNVMLAIRPEQIAMSMGASFPEDNLLRAVVTRIRFRGATSIVEFDASGLRLETRVFKVVGLNPGDECMLGLPPHRITILKN